MGCFDLVLTTDTNLIFLGENYVVLNRFLAALLPSSLRRTL